MLVDPVCGKSIDPGTAFASVYYRGTAYYLCCPLCQAAFEREPTRYASDSTDETAPHDKVALVYTVTVVAGGKWTQT